MVYIPQILLQYIVSSYVIRGYDPYTDEVLIEFVPTTASDD